MVYTYSLTVFDDDSNVVIEHDLTSDQVIKILADAIAQKAAEPRPLTVLDKQAEESAPRTGRKCGACGKSGHTARTCTSRTLKSTPARVCKKCGQPGHMAKTCPARSDIEQSSEPVDSGPKLTAEQYAEVRSRKEAGEGSWEVAEAMGVSRRQVNVAFAASTYQRYEMIADREE